MKRPKMKQDGYDYSVRPIACAGRKRRNPRTVTFLVNPSRRSDATTKIGQLLHNSSVTGAFPANRKL